MRDCYLVTLRAILFVTRVAAFLELFAAFLAAGFFGETFFVANPIHLLPQILIGGFIGIRRPNREASVTVGGCRASPTRR